MASREDEEYEKATKRGAKTLAKGPLALSARFDEASGKVRIQLNNGLEIAFTSNSAQGLESATSWELGDIEICSFGLGLHFPRLDVDLYVPALAEGIFGSTAWTAARMGAKGGAVSSEAKVAAARENGKRGGRPRSSAVTVASKALQMGASPPIKKGLRRRKEAGSK
jgi:hypothetical protein